MIIRKSLVNLLLLSAFHSYQSHIQAWPLYIFSYLFCAFKEDLKKVMSETDLNAEVDKFTYRTFKCIVFLLQALHFYLCP